MLNVLTQNVTAIQLENLQVKNITVTVLALKFIQIRDRIIILNWLLNQCSTVCIEDLDELNLTMVV